MDRLMRRRGPETVAVGVLVVVNILWGLSFPLTKTLSLQMDQHFGIGPEGASSLLRLSGALWLILLRFSLALLLFSVCFHRIVRRAGAAEWQAGMRIAALFFIGLVLQVMALATIPASRSGFLTSLVAVFTPLLTAILLRMRLRLPIVIGVCVALLGVSVLTGLLVWSDSGVHLAADAWQAWTWGDSLTTIGAVFFAGQIMLVDHYGKRLDGAALTPGMFAGTAILAAITFAIVHPLAPEAASSSDWWALASQPRFWGLIVVLSVFSSVLAFGLMNSFQHYISASQAGIVYTLEPVCASAAAMLLPGWLTLAAGVDYANEQLSLSMLAGGALIIAANLISLWPAAPTTAPEPSPASAISS